jgi:hypothetical protein
VRIKFKPQWRYKGLSQAITVLAVLFGHYLQHRNAIFWSGCFFYFANLYFINLTFGRNTHALILWKERCVPQWVTGKSLFGHFTYIKFSSPSAVKSVTLCPPKFQSFSLEDLERLKDDRKWLSDSHVTLILLLVSFSFGISLSEGNRDWFQDCSRQNIWGNLKIQLLDTFFWAHVSQDPERYGERLMSNLSLLEYDFLLMPMFNSWVYLLFPT